MKPHPTLDKMDGFQVTVQQVIGTVKLGPGGTQEPMEAAFQLIGKHFRQEGEHRPAGEPRVYTFPGPDDGETVRVTARIERGG